jgi:phospholipid/cholesterol/gamma-HCH transport system permease protein
MIQAATPHSSSTASLRDSYVALARKLGSQTLEILRFAGGFGMLSMEIFRELFRGPFYFSLVVDQLFFMGVRSFMLAAVTGLATGSVMALQFGYGLARFGGKLYIPTIVSLSILREMGPVFTSLLVAGRIGSGIASEVGSMQVTQQIDAMRALGTSPVKKIVIPRVLACLIALPILTLFADYIGIFGAMAVCVKELGINSEYFVTKAVTSAGMTDLVNGLLKTLVYAYFLSVTACWKGLNTKGGTQGVGNTTTWVVVTSSIFIMIADFFLSKLFLITLYHLG